MERKINFSIGEMVGYFLFIMIGLNIIVAIPIVIKLYPTIVEQLNTFDENQMQFGFFINDILLANIGWQILSLLVLWLIFRRKNINLKEYFQLNKNINIKNFAFVFLIFIVMALFLNPVSDYFEVPPNPIMMYLIENGNIYYITITAVIAAPIVEEVIFRGWIFNEVANRYNYTVAIHASSFLFTVIHIQYGISEMLLVLIIAYTLALLRLKTGNLLFPILFHFLNNAGALVEFLIVYR